VIAVNASQLPKAPKPIDVTPAGIVTAVNPLPAKVPLPILVTEFGIVTEVILSLFANPGPLMAFTANPPIVDGITTEAFVPVYPVIVATPFAVV
jgi:hypothetical protein